jgi:hypothetical protein
MISSCIRGPRPPSAPRRFDPGGIREAGGFPKPLPGGELVDLEDRWQAPASPQPCCGRDGCYCRPSFEWTTLNDAMRLVVDNRVWIPQVGGGPPLDGGPAGPVPPGPQGPVDPGD